MRAITGARRRAAWATSLAVLCVSLAAAPVWADTAPAPAPPPAAGAAVDPAPDPVSGPARVQGRVLDLIGKPIAGANVHIVAGGRVEQTVSTDADGHYRAELHGTGSYALLFAFGGKSAQKRAVIEPGAELSIDVELEVAPGEVIQVLDLRPAAIAPKPVHDVRRPLEYSPRAVVSDAWTKAWFLLDVNASGEVARVKLLKRPGYDLDEIAVRTAFTLKFAPGRDASGKAVPTWIVWGMEWPSMGWMQAYTGTATQLPDGDRPIFEEWRPAVAKVKCAGAGPLPFEGGWRGYRDCSRPDLSLAPKLPWLSKPR